METVDEDDDEDLSSFIDAAVRDAKAHVHQTKDQNDAIIHRPCVCIVCDYFI